MERKITYSFIIPHHNTPDLLQRLVDSIPQREDIEIIVVDDNSDEGRKANITRSDVRTIYIDKEHTKGAGRARNVGMDAAKGKWLLFADADDLYKPNFIEVLDKYKNDDIDILFFNVDSVDSITLKPGPNRARIVQQVINNFDGSKKSVDELLYGSWGPWRKMLSSYFVKLHDFRYEEVPVGNDVFFAFQTAYFAKKYKVEHTCLYTLTFLKGSISFSKIHRNKYISNLISLRRRAKFYEYIGHSEWNKQSIRGTYAQSCVKYVLGIIKKQPSSGIQALLYLLFHWFAINRKSTYYIDVVEDIKRKMICREILTKR